MSLGFFELFALFLRRNLIIICLQIIPFEVNLRNEKFLFPRKIFVFLGACLSEFEAKLFPNASGVPRADMLLKISNLNCSLSYRMKLRYVYFFGLNFSYFFFENSMYHMMLIT